MPSAKLKKFCKNPTVKTFANMSGSDQKQFFIIAKIVVAKKFKLEKNPQKLVDTVIKYFGIFHDYIPHKNIENEVIQLMKDKLNKMPKDKQIKTIEALRMYTFCFDRVINELLNQHYKGNKVSSFPILECIREGDSYDRVDFTADEFGTYYKDICDSLEYPKKLLDFAYKTTYYGTTIEEDANALTEFVSHAKAAYPYIINGCVEFPKTVRLFRGMKIEKGTPFDINNYVNNSLSSCTNSYSLAIRFATMYFSPRKSTSDYDKYVYDIYFPPGTKMISPGACALQDEHEIIICNRFTCEVVSTQSITVLDPTSMKVKVQLVTCIAHISSIVDKITNNLILHDDKHGKWKAATS